MIGKEIRQEELAAWRFEHKPCVPDQIDEELGCRHLEHPYCKVFKDSGRGRKSHPPAVLFNVRLLQQWYGLSDPMAEKAVGGWLTFLQGFGLGLHEAVPDETTIFQFRRRLAEKVLADQLLRESNRQLDVEGLLVKHGTVVDASLIEAQTRPPGKNEPNPRQDVDANWMVKNNQPTSGFKLNIGVGDGRAFNGHFGCTCCRPLFCFKQHGDLERGLLRKDNVHTAEDWRSVLKPVMARNRGQPIPRYFRGDAGFAAPDIYRLLEHEGYGYAIRLKSNRILGQHFEHLLTCPSIRKSGVPDVRFEDFAFQAASWDRPRRVVAKVTWFADRLFPAVDFIVTNLNWVPRRGTHFFNQRGTAELWIKEDKYAPYWTRLFCHGFAANQVRLQLFALAYNLGNLLRRLALPQSISHWSLRTLQTSQSKSVRKWSDMPATPASRWRKYQSRMICLRPS